MPARRPFLASILRPLGDLLAWFVATTLYISVLAVIGIFFDRWNLPTFPIFVALLVGLFLFSPLRLLRQLIWGIPPRAGATSRGRQRLLTLGDAACVLVIFLVCQWTVAMEPYGYSSSPYAWTMVDMVELLALLVATFFFSPLRFVRKLVWDIPMRAKAQSRGRQWLLILGDALCVVLLVGLIILIMIAVYG